MKNPISTNTSIVHEQEIVVDGGSEIFSSAVVHIIRMSVERKNRSQTTTNNKKSEVKNSGDAQYIRQKRKFIRYLPRIVVCFIIWKFESCKTGRNIRNAMKNMESNLLQNIRMGKNVRIKQWEKGTTKSSVLRKVVERYINWKQNQEKAMKMEIKFFTEE